MIDPASGGVSSPDEENTAVTRRRRASWTPDADEDLDATQISARRGQPVAVASTEADAGEAQAQVDDATRISARRSPDEIDDQTRTSERRALGPSRSPAPEPLDELTEETVLRSVRRADAAGVHDEVPAAEPVVGRTAYVPGGEASDRRQPRRPEAVIAARQPVVSPSSITPAPAPGDAIAQRRRERRRVLIGVGVGVIVVAAIAVAALLLLI